MSPNINTLPPEIIILILENLPNSDTLFAAVLSCQRVYDAVNPYIPSVLTSIVLLQIASLRGTSDALNEVVKSISRVRPVVRDLQDQAMFLTLGALEGVVHDYGDDVLALELSLQQCDLQCVSIAQKIAKRTVKTSDNTISNWKYMLSSYNLTFRVALGKARLQRVSLTSAVLKQYQIMIKQAKLDLAEQAIIAHLLPETSNTRKMLTREKRSIERCLYICNRALEFTVTSNFQARKGQSTLISSINELLPKERPNSAMFAELTGILPASY
ncbi:hypothetical protein PITC_073380 [Penicillium italicum]|uniref:F-box domain-containing protein n=1 Tax=Penicillium italicum TaxID=40296 RepID=A0A0A2L788_PENIT|nr:hypothetical protein PITC_073380 [Penicillium italicum]